MALRVSIPKETVPGERRVAVTPEIAQRLVKQGLSVVVEAGAGVAAYYPDRQYTDVG
ncbi:MAG TPA: NAD(P)(+) transhydrogenase (Re/Si-specific) subunit alpha, partial [Thermoplasmata archaeon]|nr:NAD(P)(+) transhydrogenase (Re/Si-specific) subunit alpha [Thermoplasmata archaeon]